MYLKNTLHISSELFKFAVVLKYVGHSNTKPIMYKANDRMCRTSYDFKYQTNS